MAMGHGGGGPSESVSNHPALASASASPPFQRRGRFVRKDETGVVDSFQILGTMHLKLPLVLGCTLSIIMHSALTTPVQKRASHRFRTSPPC